MTSPDPLAERLGAASRIRATVLRLGARLKAPVLDCDLATGIRPSASAAHLARADLITRLHARRRIRDAIYGALRRAAVPPGGVTAQAPLSVGAIRACRNGLKTLAEAVVTTENPRVQGVAIAHQLVFDGRSALYYQPHKDRSEERLANTIHAALSALRVSSEFDRADDLPGARA